MSKKSQEDFETVTEIQGQRDIAIDSVLSLIGMLETLLEQRNNADFNRYVRLRIATIKKDNEIF